MSSSKTLFLIDINALNVSTTADYVDAFKASRYKHHIVDFRVLYFKKFNLDNYNSVTLHWSVNLNSKINLKLLGRLKYFRGLKVIFKQDEYKNINQLEKFILENDFKIFFSSISKENIKKIYSSKFRKKIVIHSILTAYIPNYFKKLKIKEYSKRKYDIGYRGRDLPYNLGSLSQEKKNIGLYFRNKKINLNLNISVDEESRIYGKNWFYFLSECKSVLGTESGFSIVDFNGDIEKKVNKMILKNPDLSFQSCYSSFLFKYDKKIKMHVISSRVFEAIASRCLLILFKGDYSGIIKPLKHYLPLEKDFSNLEEVLTILRNKEKVIDIINSAYKDVILNDKLSYDWFINKYDDELSSKIKLTSKKNLFVNQFLNFLTVLLIKSYNSLKYLKPLVPKIILKRIKMILFLFLKFED